MNEIIKICSKTKLIPLNEAVEGGYLPTRSIHTARAWAREGRLQNMVRNGKCIFIAIEREAAK